MPDKSLVPAERIEGRILVIRGHRVLIDADLAELYGVPTKVLNQAVKRNADRFPEDFAFRLTLQEAEAMRSQFVTASKRNVRYHPFAFTEHGAIMAANVLNSCRAIEASVWVVRAFVRLRQMLASNRDLARRLDEMEKRYNAQFKVVFDAIRELMAPPPGAPKEPIGFRPARHLPRGKESTLP